MNIRVDLSGLRLDEAIEKLQTGMLRGVKEGAELIARTAKENLQGDARGKHLMSSIHTEVKGYYDFVIGKVGVGAATGIDGEAGENFGIYVHEGTGIYSRSGMGRKEVPWFYMDAQYVGHQTSGMQPNPFLENAYDSEGQNVAQIIADAIMN